MRRTMHVLAVTGVVLGMGLNALPATASTAAGSAAAGRTSLATGHAGPSGRTGPTTAQQRALTRADRISALLGQRGAITGMVLGAAGAPRANVCVSASGPMATRTAFTRADGRFIISGLPRGAYRVQYRGCSRIGRYVGQWYGGLTRGSATQVLVMSARPVQLAPVRLGTISPRFAIHRASAIHRALATPRNAAERLLAELRSGALARANAAASARSARVSGVVTSRAGHPLGGVCVLAAQSNRGRPFGVAFGTQTAKSGGYTVRVPRAGRYYVVFLSECAASGNFAPQMWKGAGSIAAARVLRIRTGQVIRHIDAVLGPGAAISGRVRSAGHTHVSFAGMCVDALGVAGQRLFQGSATVRANGTFRLRDLATGKYRLQFFPGCGPQAAYLPASPPKPVAVTDGKTTTGISVTLRLGGAITGVVKDAGGHPLAGICVSAFGSTSGAGTQTGAGGAYRIGGLSTGAYQMQFSPGCGNNGSYAPLTLPNLIPVTAGKTTAGINATMQLAGTISGVVKDSHGTTLGGICVVAQGAGGQGFGFATTGAAGTYQVPGLPAGGYQVQFIPGGVFSNCGNNGNYLPVALSATVNSGKNTGLDAVLPAGGVISGVVSDNHGHRLAGICVFSSSQNGNQVATASDGSYSMTQLFTGSYDVGFSGGCGNHGSVAPQAYRGHPTFIDPDAVSVTAGQTTAGIDAAMQPGGTIAGQVTDLAGHPLNRICVFITGATGAGGAFQFAAQEVTRDGRYQLVNLPPGQFTVNFGGIFKPNFGCVPSGRYAGQNFRGRTLGAVPDLVSVPSGVITGGVNAALGPAGSISGVVRNRAGRGLPGTCVTAIDPRTQAEGFTSAGAHGKYTITDIPAGRYRVQFSICNIFLGFGTNPNYADQWYRDRPTEASATPVIVQAGHVTPHIDATLAKGGSITGQVVFGPANRPVSFVCVIASSTSGGQFGAFGEGLTDRRGHYVVTGLSTGRYVLEFSPCLAEAALANQFRPGLVHVIAGRTVAGINQRLVVGGSVSGALTGQTAHGPKSAPGACVEVLPLTPTGVPALTIAGAGGSYAVTKLAPGRYQVFFGDPGCSGDSPALAPQFFPGKPLVISGQTTSGISATLSLDGGIAGLVRGPAHSPVAGICAEVVPVNGTAGGAGRVIAVTGAGGYHAIDLVPGSYKVRFEAGCGVTGYATRWYKNARTMRQATIVHVSAGTITGGIDVTLPRG